MSGYLHRLVHQVMHARETVHPRMGSLFAPYWSEPDSPAEWFEPAETVTTRPARSDSSKRGEPAKTVLHPARSDASQSPLLPGTAGETPRIFESAQRPDVSRHAGNEVQHDAREPAVQVPRQLVAQQAQGAVSDSTRDTGVQSHVPLIHPPPNALNSTNPESRQFSTEAPPSRSETSAKFPVERRVPRAQRETDEIQIHIGRIEVTAVQPSAPRAPRPPDKAISLDAYLERRNGRAR
jgi:hypothetical protein